MMKSPSLPPSFNALNTRRRRPVTAHDQVPLGPDHPAAFDSNVVKLYRLIAQINPAG
jgi:hypothetical protein